MMAQQLMLFGDRQGILIDVSVAALTTEPELREIGRALITLTRYWESKLSRESQCTT